MLLVSHGSRPTPTGGVLAVSTGDVGVTRRAGRRGGLDTILMPRSLALTPL